MKLIKFGENRTLDVEKIIQVYESDYRGNGLHIFEIKISLIGFTMPLSIAKIEGEDNPEFDDFKKFLNEYTCK